MILVLCTGADNLLDYEESSLKNPFPQEKNVVFCKHKLPAVFFLLSLNTSSYILLNPQAMDLRTALTKLSVIRGHFINP